MPKINNFNEVNFSFAQGSLQFDHSRTYAPPQLSQNQTDGETSVLRI